MKKEPVHSKGDQPWDFFGRNDTKAETPVLWPPHAKSWLIGKYSDAGRDWGQEERGWQRMRWLNSITDLMDVSLSETLGVGDGQGGLACCDSWGRKQSDTTERLNWTELNWCYKNTIWNWMYSFVTITKSSFKALGLYWTSGDYWNSYFKSTQSMTQLWNMMQTQLCLKRRCSCWSP